MARAGLALAMAAAALAAAAIAPSPAPAELSLCGPGTEAGQCERPEGIGADPDTDRLFVAERGNDRVSVFEASSGEFLYAFGWGVSAAAPEEALQECTTASGCLQGEEGSGAGQLDQPRWLAVDTISAGEAAGDVYVSDHNRINRYEADGSFVGAFGWGVDAEEPKEELQLCTTATGCLPGEPGLGECQLGGNRQPVAVGPEGRVFAVNTFGEGASGSSPPFTNRVEVFSPEGECLGETVLAVGNHREIALAVDGAEDAYVADEREAGKLLKYDLETPETLLCDMDPGEDPGEIETNSVAIDGAGHLLAGQREEADRAGTADHQVVTEYETACPPTELLRRYGYGRNGENLLGLAALVSGGGEVFGAEELGGVRYLDTPPPGALLARLYDPFTIGNVRAGLALEANPEGEESTVEIQYVSDADFLAEGFGGEGTESLEAPVPFEAGMEYRARAVEVQLGCEEATEEAIEKGECLTPETIYHWRARAFNPSGDVEGWQVGESFETLPPIEIDVFAAALSTDTATLGALVDALGVPASGYFEYVEQETFEESGFDEATKVPDVDAEPPQEELGFGEAEGTTVRQTTTLYPLSPGTTYRYRLIAANPFFGGIPSEAKSFTTHLPAAEAACPNDAERLGAATLLPDCRAYELVSPLDKEGGDIIVQPEGLTRELAVLEQSATSGNRLAYGSYRAFGEPKSAPYTSQYIARRLAGSEWQSHAINPPEEEVIGGLIETDNEYRAFSDDLCEGWLAPWTEPPLAAGAIEGFQNLYRRADELCGGAPDYAALSTAEPEDADPSVYRLEPQGSAADRSVEAFGANDSLVETAAPSTPGLRQRAYVKGPGEGAPLYACMLPSGEASEEACSAGTSAPAENAIGRARLANVTGALSEDGERLYWSEGPGPGPLYVRERPLGEGANCAEAADSPCTRQVSGEDAQFWAAAKADGASAYYTTGSLNGGIATLHRYDAEAEESEVVAEGLYGFVGASADAEVAYLASGEAIEGAGENSEGDEAVAGEANLYRYEAGSGAFAFIATLALQDVRQVPFPGESSAVAREPVRRSSRVAADGGSVAFMSAAPLTGFDNTDASSLEACGKAEGLCDTEAFVYAAGSGELVCASCNPGNARPEGADVNPVEGEEEEFWVAARIPAWETTLYAPAVLAADGDRLFFESRDPLVARDVNERFDVYQWERRGKGSCRASSSTYSGAAQGCIGLISSGQSVRHARILDASPNGRDVFFATLQSLLPQDPDQVDVYDARAGGGLPVPPTPPAECEGEGCQSPAPAPPFSTPGSEIFFGPGNLAAQSGRPAARCNRSTRRARRLAHRAKAMRAKARRAARAGNRRAARRRMRGARRSARKARGLSRNAKRCRARARAARRSRR